MNKTNDITCLIGVGGKKYKPTHFPRFNDSSPPWATLVSLLRQADVCLRLRDPLETADLRLLSHLTNMQLFVVNVLQFHLTAFTRDFECLSEKTSDSIKLKLQRMQKLTISQIYHELSFISLIRDLTIYDGNLDDDGGG